MFYQNNYIITTILLLFLNNKKNTPTHQFNWATNPLSGLKIGVYLANSSDPLDFDANDALCGAAPNGPCTKYFPVPGVYYFSSGIIVDGFAFGGKITVDDNVPQIAENIMVLISGMCAFPLGHPARFSKNLFDWIC